VIADAASIVLGVVFVVAGASKLAAPRSWTAQAAGLGVPSGPALIVPPLEVVLGGVLVSGWGAPLAIWCALAVLAAFTVVLVVNLARGRRPACACFGAWSASPIGWGHVARNAVFGVIGVVALVG
jgi:uncharacterized membrane protein YphA (DoxX/SURF4 family)